jgi:glycosyltransferase involved in cell wall biosynthesis
MTPVAAHQRRILFLLRSLHAGGAERQLVVLASGLQKRGHDVTVAVYHPGGAYERLVLEAGIRLVCLDKGRLHHNFSFFRRAVRLVNSLQPHVIHGYMETGNIVASALKAFAHESVIVWGVRASALDLSFYGTSDRILFELTRLASPTADTIIANSHAGAEHVVRAGYPADKVVVIPNGIDTARFSPSPGRGAELRREWGVAPEERLIGLVARFDPMKDHLTFISAAGILARRRPDVRFICIGQTAEPYRSRVLDELRGSGLGDRVMLKGFAEEMPAVQSALDVATSSSAYGEGFSNAIAEAMACGSPCVVTDVGDSRLIVGDTGIVVPPKNPQALANAWDALLARTGASLSAACRQRVIDQFSVEQLIRSTVRVLTLEPDA